MALGFLDEMCRERYRSNLQDTTSVKIKWKEVEWLMGQMGFDDYGIGKFLENLIGFLINGEKVIMNLNNGRRYDNWLLVKWGRNPEETFELIYPLVPSVRRLKWCLVKWYVMLGFFGFSTKLSCACCVFFFLIGMCLAICVFLAFLAEFFFFMTLYSML